jgi:tRNA (mo5U34)-methyltransferase
MASRQAPPAPPPREELAAEVAALDWYHTIELAPGLCTPGYLDTRSVVAAIPFPASLAGKRCLDVATFNGFWAFEMERRGASEVVAIDVRDPLDWDWPVDSDDEVKAAIGARHARGRGFEIAREALDSRVERRELSVYELDQATVGRFDVVYLGSLLVHLRDPVRALERIRSVCDESLIVADGIDLPLSLLLPRTPVARFDGRGRPWWWYSNAAGLARLLEAGGFEVVEGPRRIYMPPGAGQPTSKRRFRSLRSRAGREALIIAWKGDPHAVALARPRPSSGSPPA